MEECQAAVRIKILCALPYVHRSTVYNSQDMETTECPSTDEWIKKMWSICTMEYYAAIKG